MGLANVRDRLSALFGARGRFTLEDVLPRGARATMEIPFEVAIAVAETENAAA